MRGFDGSDAIAFTMEVAFFTGNTVNIWGDDSSDTLTVDVSAKGAYNNDIAVYGGTGNDEINFTFAASRLSGNNFDIYGGTGDDTINLLLYGSASSSSNTTVDVYGGAGADSINGLGVATNIVFHYSSTSELGDSISGFDSTSIRFMFDGSAFTGDVTTGGNLASSDFLVGSGLTSNNFGGHWLFDTAGSTHTLKYDPDGTGAAAAMTVATFTGNINLTADNIGFLFS